MPELLDQLQVLRVHVGIQLRLLPGQIGVFKRIVENIIEARGVVAGERAGWQVAKRHRTMHLGARAVLRLRISKSTSREQVMCC